MIAIRMESTSILRSAFILSVKVKQESAFESTKRRRRGELNSIFSQEIARTAYFMQRPWKLRTFLDRICDRQFWGKAHKNQGSSRLVKSVCPRLNPECTQKKVTGLEHLVRNTELTTG